MNKDRKSGYYWVKLHNDYAGEIAYYQKTMDMWYLFGEQKRYTDVEFYQIDENQITRDESKDKMQSLPPNSPNKPL